MFLSGLILVTRNRCALFPAVWRSCLTTDISASLPGLRSCLELAVWSMRILCGPRKAAVERFPVCCETQHLFHCYRANVYLQTVHHGIASVLHAYVHDLERFPDDYGAITDNLTPPFCMPWIKYYPCSCKCVTSKSVASYNLLRAALVI